MPQNLMYPSVLQAHGESTCCLGSAATHCKAEAEDKPDRPPEPSRVKVGRQELHELAMVSNLRVCTPRSIVKDMQLHALTVLLTSLPELIEIRHQIASKELAYPFLDLGMCK